MSPVLDLDIREGVAELTLRRPPVNALDEELLDALERCVVGLDADPAARCMLIRSNNDRVFCAGADIAMIESRLESPTEMVEFVRRVQRVFAILESHRLPTVVELGGSATGGGLELALACDFRVAGRDVLIGLPEVNIGLLPGAGGTQRLTQVAGRGVAMDLILGGRLITGVEAQEREVVQWAVPRSDVRSTAWTLARDLATRPPLTIALAKECIGLAGRPGGFERELSATADLLKTADTADLVRAFLARRRTKEQR